MTKPDVYYEIVTHLTDAGGGGSITDKEQKNLANARLRAGTIRAYGIEHEAPDGSVSFYGSHRIDRVVITPKDVHGVLGESA